MSRPLRYEHPGALWHVTARGNERQDIYRDDTDRSRFLEELARAVTVHAWRLHAWVQMGNHYHLVIETPEPTLSRGMAQLNGAYGRAFNRRHRRVGHLFQGRFHGVLVQKESHLLELTRYVVLNPVRAGFVAAPGDWAWSSYRATLGDCEAPEWLEVQWTLSHFGGSPARYAAFVAEGRGVPLTGSLRGQIYLGSDTFSQRIRERVALVTRDPEIPRPQRQPDPSPPALVLARVLSALRLDPDALIGDRRGLGPERALVAFALRRHGRVTSAAIAPILGVSPWRASHLARRGEELWGQSGLDGVLAANSRPDPRGSKQQT